MSTKHIIITRNNDERRGYGYDISLYVIHNGKPQRVKGMQGMALIDALQTEVIPFFGEQKEIETRWIEEG